MLLLLVLPFWISYLMRMLAWTNLLQTDGMVNDVLRWLHLQQSPRNWLDGNGQTVVLAAEIAVAVVATPRPVAKAKVPANPWRSERSTGPRL